MIGYRFYQKVYNRTIRPYLPTKYRLLAGVAVQDTPLFDFSADEPEYKRGLMKAIKQGVNEGDEVELIGFGRGVSAVRTFDEGARHIIAYEAAEEMIKLGKKLLKIIDHAIVIYPFSNRLLEIQKIFMEMLAMQILSLYQDCVSQMC